MTPATGSPPAPPVRPPARPEQAPFRTLLLHTHNVIRALQPFFSPPVSKPSSSDNLRANGNGLAGTGVPSSSASSSASSTSVSAPAPATSGSRYGTGELPNAVHETLHLALDGNFREEVARRRMDLEGKCSDDTGNKGPTHELPLGVNGVQPNGNGEGEKEAGEQEAGPSISYHFHPPTSTLSIPHPASIPNPIALDPCCPEPREAYDVTVKFFYLSSSSPSAPAEADGQGEGRGEYGGNETEKRDRFPAEWALQGLERLTRTTGLITVDTFILRFPDDELEKDASTGFEGVRSVWAALSPQPSLLSLGVADFTLQQLQSFMSSLSPPPPSRPSDEDREQGPTVPSLAPIPNPNPSTKAATASVPSSDPQPVAGPGTLPSQAPLPASTGTTNGTNKDVSPARFSSLSRTFSNVVFSTPSATRRLRVNQVNLRDLSNGRTAGSGSGSKAGSPVARAPELEALSSWCNENGVGLSAHGDPRDILPPQTLPFLLSEFLPALPHPLPPRADASLRRVRERAWPSTNGNNVGADANGAPPVLGKLDGVRPLWALKYTVIIRDRGVVADKGYILCAELD